MQQSTIRDHSIQMNSFELNDPDKSFKVYIFFNNLKRKTTECWFFVFLNLKQIENSYWAIPSTPPKNWKGFGCLPLLQKKAAQSKHSPDEQDAGSWGQLGNSSPVSGDHGEFAPLGPDACRTQTSLYRLKHTNILLLA